MSKSGSRYGRRSNWFKIHCLLQEQQQAQDVANQTGHQKARLISSNSLSLMKHPSYASNQFSRTPCTAEELMMLRLEDYMKHPVTTSSSISSPDSHKSDGSIEVGDKRNTISESSYAPNKDLLLSLPFSGFSLMPPPFIPQSHFLFASYHNAFLEQNHHLMQQKDQQDLHQNSELPSLGNKVHLSNDNERINSDLEAAVMIKREPSMNGNPEEKIKDGTSGEKLLKTHNHVLTPPRSPNQNPTCHNPIDLSMSTTKKQPLSNSFPRNGQSNLETTSFSSNRYGCDDFEIKCKREGGDDEDANFEGKYNLDSKREFKRRKSYSSALDLSIKV